MPEVDKLNWIEPTFVEIPAANLDTNYVQRILRAIIRDELPDEAYTSRAVYVIRLTGSTIIKYPLGSSPVLYIGRGNCCDRICNSHTNWLSDLSAILKDVSIRIDICIPRRRNNIDFYKNIEADLISMFYDKYAAIPFYNSNRQNSFSGMIKYSESALRTMRSRLSVGRGNRHFWSIIPLRSNPLRPVYLANMDSTRVVI